MLGKNEGGRRAACNKTGVSLSPFDAIWQEIAADRLIAEPEREVSRHCQIERALGHSLRVGGRCLSFDLSKRDHIADNKQHQNQTGNKTDVDRVDVDLL